VDPEKLKSNTFTVTFASGGSKEFPEVDRADWFRADEARKKILEAQAKLVDDLSRKLDS
jgi:predicted NUDIX family NTP pyrophosphohydrolase